MRIGIENVSALILDLKGIRSQKSIWAWVKTFFFWSFGHKTGPNLSEDLFFCLHLILDTKSFQFQEKTVLVWFYAPETAPSLLQFFGYAPAEKSAGLK